MGNVCSVVNSNITDLPDNLGSGSGFQTFQDYAKFVANKLTHSLPTGIENPPEPHPSLFPHQRDLVMWALRRGRCAVFANTGLGKTCIQLEWAKRVVEYTRKPVLILAPLAVSSQTVVEGLRLGIDVTLCRESKDITTGVNITNYERLHKFDSSLFGGVVLDESSCIKYHDSKTLRLLLDAFATTAFKLCTTATPAPNDYTELGTHAEFLGICLQQEMLAEYFIHDGGSTQDWRLKGHAKTSFWEWVASWAALVRSPSDIGYIDDRYTLSPLKVIQHTIASDQRDVFASGLLFAAPAQSLNERRSARRGTVSSRVTACADLVASDQQTWVVWCDLNDESKALTRAISGSVEITGSMSTEEKEARLVAFSRGEFRVLVTKPSIAGFGLNWQHCARTAFVGVTDSWESYYQAIRRFWRFGQTREVQVHVFASDLEGAVVANLQRKERDAERMAEELSAQTREVVRSQLQGTVRVTNSYKPKKTMIIPSWLRSEEV